MNPLVSIIIPVYNAELYLERCLNSVINQTYENLEILLINDGSTDNSKNICTSFKKKDNRIRLINQVNGGSSIARNTGLDQAQGEIISFIDSDDHIDLKMITIMVDLLLTHDLEVVEAEPDNPTKKKSFDGSFRIEDQITATKRILKNTSFSVWRRIYKKSLIGEMRFIPKLIHQDVFFTIDLLKKISKIGYLNTPLYIYNTGNIGSIIRSKYSVKKITTGIKATEYIKDHVPNKDALDEVVKNYIVYYYTDHFYLLSKNKHVDPGGYYRKKLKREISKAASNNNLSFRSLVVMTLPIKVSEKIYALYRNLK
ncbi:Glycosyltransferase involved in cell wall bisynthesis [Zhouia amylolytica]|uniref:Glycosyltransferase involved in cell wall bisynthesis n=1 Tax=Zhouia amylolytica TaxID=376730 RepID=A0A1I6VKH4_9FLAO|nr:glycosyltransferase [Zhouia amylolytica]SFT14223.1 Glycosyltransferase involved in cell wall bisynthesis [Zhouia amylolytica]